ncbi:hypothetical protein KUTeg_014563 [Tegillarca granosa]|uniref:Uncharacterized protein n=1 Tax=Tegillarca granosa TaxID=220873 RepID=A0ABQ9EVX2_TEGGR|nr:hypothetical protein KUTeg_014563 [Tegillarca granosa]
MVLFQAFLFDNVEGKTLYLIDNNIIKTCKREFRWNYPNREQMDYRQLANSQKPKTTLDESDEELNYSGKTDEQRILDEIVKEADTCVKKFNNSSELLNESYKCDEQHGDIGVTGKKSGDSGEIHEKPSDGSKTSDQPCRSGKNIEEAVNTGGNNDDVETDEPSMEIEDYRQLANSQKPKTTLDESDEELNYSGKTDEQRILDEIVKEADTCVKKFNKSSELLNVSYKCDEQHGDIGVTGKKSGDGGEIHEKPSDGGKTSDQPCRSGKNIEEAVNTGGNNDDMETDEPSMEIEVSNLLRI